MHLQYCVELIYWEGDLTAFYCKLPKLTIKIFNWRGKRYAWKVFKCGGGEKLK